MVVLSENTQTEKEAESERQTRRRRRRREETEFREKRGGMGGKKLKRGRNCKGPYREERLCFFFGVLYYSQESLFLLLELICVDLGNQVSGNATDVPEHTT